MPILIKMPALSPTMKTGKVVEWKKKEGDSVEAGDVVCTIETDKALMEVESSDDGTLTSIQCLEGAENVPVGKVIAYLLEEGEGADALDKLLAEQPKPNDASSDKGLVEQKEHKASDAPQEQESSAKRLFVTPLARKIAQDRGLNLSQIQGTGPRGRICKKDVENIAQQGTSHTLKGETEMISAVRQIIGERLLESKTTTPHFYVEIDVDMTAADEVKSIFKAKKKPVTLHHIIMRATALALQDCPQLNIRKEGDKIRYLENSDVSFALALPDNGLLTPIVMEAEKKSICMIAEHVRSLANKGRDGTLQPNEFQGGSICVTNLGMYGVRSFAAIINPPQVSILAVGALRKELLLNKGQISERLYMSCTLSADHRLVDGVAAAEFLQCLKSYLEAPILLTI